MDAKPRELYLLFRAYEVSVFKVLSKNYIKMPNFLINRAMKDLF